QLKREKGETGTIHFSQPTMFAFVLYPYRSQQINAAISDSSSEFPLLLIHSGNWLYGEGERGGKGSRWIQLTKETTSMLLSEIQRTHYWENLTNHFHVLAVELGGSRDLVLGFVCPLIWYYATILYFGNYYHKDPRERAGLAACAIAALVFTTAAVITVVAIV
ncbi:hypothetical protein CR513_31793, partial [Mucuna pruriens]